DDEALAIGQGDAGIGAPNVQCWYLSTGDYYASGKIQLTDLGRDLEVDPITVDNRWSQVQTDTVFLVLDGQRIAATAGNRHGEFATSQEAGALAAERDQTGLGEGVGEAALFQRVERTQKLAAAATPDDIETVCGQGHRRARSDAADLTHAYAGRSGTGRAEQEVVGLGAKDAHP